MLKIGKKGEMLKWKKANNSQQKEKGRMKNGVFEKQRK
jgi:hypothetical protein